MGYVRPADHDPQIFPLATRVTVREGQAWQAWCKSQRIPSATVIRRLILAEMERNGVTTAGQLAGATAPEEPA